MLTMNVYISIHLYLNIFIVTQTVSTLTFIHIWEYNTFAGCTVFLIMNCASIPTGYKVTEMNL